MLVGLVRRRVMNSQHKKSKFIASSVLFLCVVSFLYVKFSSFLTKSEMVSIVLSLAIGSIIVFVGIGLFGILNKLAIKAVKFLQDWLVCIFRYIAKNYFLGHAELGWKRLSIVSTIPGFCLIYIFILDPLNDYGAAFFLSFALTFFVPPLVILGRKTFVWVKKGFEDKVPGA